jgi:uncharacterized protein (TIGR02271 family)
MHTVICAFDDRADAQRAMDRLIERGFSRDMVHLQGGYEGGDASTSGSSSAANHTGESQGFFHSIGKFFSELFDSDDNAGEAGRYAEAVRRGSTVLVVDAVDEQEADRARSVMSEMGGTIDIDERASRWTSEGWTGYDPSATSQTGGLTGAAATTSGAAMLGATDRRPEGQEERVMPVVREELQVGKREVEKGGVRVIQRVTQTPVKEMVRLREERAIVERRPVDRAATEADLANFKESSIEVRETAEEAVVGKTARVVEEVVVGKDVQQRTETVADTVRRTDVEVEQLDPSTGSRSETGTRTGVDDGEGLLEKTGRKIKEGAHELKNDLTPGGTRQP